MHDDCLKDLNELRDYPVPEESLDQGLIHLRAFMAAHPMIKARRGFLSSFPAFAWKPATTAALAMAVLGGAGGIVYAAGSAMPGERLYGVKILAEEVRANLAVSSDEKFRLRAEQAERRLSEAQAIMRDDAETPEERERRIDLAMRRYQNQMLALNALAEGMEKTPERSARASVAAAAVERVLARHETLAESASTTEDAKAQAEVVLPMRQAFELESRVLNALSAQERIGLRVKDRAERFRRSWKSLDEKLKEKQGGARAAGGSGDEHADDHTEASQSSADHPILDLRVRAAESDGAEGTELGTGSSATSASGIGF